MAFSASSPFFIASSLSKSVIPERLPGRAVDEHHHPLRILETGRPIAALDVTADLIDGLVDTFAEIEACNACVHDFLL